MSATDRTGGAGGGLDRLGRLLERRTDRRGVLTRSALVATALATVPLGYLLRPQSAYAAVCGEGASCSSGWTSFCCTVNNGVNRCPPGTFAGGWWKADGSAYCCSGSQRRPRYIIDCHGRCTCGCGSGHFCADSCRTCRCRCADNGTCDQRKTCCNNFRYGQCHQEISCSGPVACRMVTCTPPYELYDSCGSSSATDNRTVTHNAPCLGEPCA
jgi:hypothetical protein